MKFKLIVLLILFICIKQLSAQNFEASYKVTRYLTIATGSGKKETLQLDLEGKLYRKNNRFISFAKPLYLEKYPGGTIESKGPEQQKTNTFTLFMDTIQCLSYADLDSMLLRKRNDGTGINYEGTNLQWSIEPGAWQWEIKPDKKIIGGLNCQRGIRRRTNSPDEIVYDIWFCSDIEMPVGISGTLDVPGLIVEASIPPLNMTWSLQSYSVQAALPDKLFWPAVFNQPFEKRAPLKAPR